MDGKGITFAELDHRANQLARQLIESGIGKGDRVGVYLNKCLEMPIAVYGVLKAGAAYVPLDPSAPPQRLAYIINDCGIKILISQQSKLKKLQALFEAVNLTTVLGLSDPDLPCPTHSWEEIEKLEPDWPNPPELTEEDLAYILYTSGSTGSPKGIMHTHRSGLAYARTAVHLYDLNEQDRMGNHSPLHFDMSTFEFFGGPLSGATVVLVPLSHTKLPASLANLIEKEALTIWYSVPFALIQLLLRGEIAKKDFSALRWILYAGEAFPVKYLRALMKQLPHAKYSNVYGPTETNQCTNYDLPAPPSEEMDSVPLGRVCPNTKGLILDGQNNPVAPGEVGELLISSATMMKGYWNKPELNKKAFWRTRLYPDFELVYYRTGDLVQLNANNDLIFWGRKDRQIKSRGYRVELDEIETALLKCHSVEEAAAFPGKTFEGSVQIAAAVTLKNGHATDQQNLIIEIKERLPWYAVPATLTILPHFPRTSTGKIDRRALQEQSEESWKPF